MPLPIQIGTVTQALQRAFGFKGRYTPMLDEVIVPVYVISDPSPAAITRIGAAVATVGSQPDPGQSNVSLFNPPGSGSIVNVTNVVSQSDIKTQLRIVLFDGASGNKRPDIHYRDRRNQGEPTTQVRRQNASTGPVVGDLVAIVQVDGALAQTASWEANTADPRQPLAVLGENQGVAVEFPAGLTTGDSLVVNFRFLEIPISQINPAGGLPG